MIAATTLVWGAGDWFPVAAGFAALLFILLVLGYWRAAASPAVRVLAAAFKLFAILILVLCLLEPLFSSQRARPGENQFALLADNSQSMTLKDAGDQSRGEQLKKLAANTAPWAIQLARDFELRDFSFDLQLHSVDNFAALNFDGRSSDLGAALDRLVNRYQGRPLAGVLLFTDGSATDTAAVEKLLAKASLPDAHIPPIYPVLMGQKSIGRDINLERISVRTTNFEDAPVTLTADITTTALRGRTIVADLLDESGKPLQEQKVTVDQDGQPIAVRFSIRPDKPGLSFYRVNTAIELPQGQSQPGENDREITLVNNSRMVSVERPKGPYRVLYVAGRPNWEYKFLERSVVEDDQVQLLGLIRVAKREPKFDFLGKPGDSANPLYRGFEGKDRDIAETYDQPVLIRFGTADEDELKAGFPKTADELFKYDALILDDVEAEFFTQDQMQLVKDFVRQRGGGLLMLGGEESFKNGKYDRTPIGDLLPVYSDQIPDLAPDTHFHLSLTREGWLEPWLRLHPEEDADRLRLAGMPAFFSLNQIRGIKPGATVLARADTEAAPGTASISVPALVEQHFGRGRSAALSIGDFWQWQLHRPSVTDTDMQKAWRQTIRWLVGEVPARVDVAVAPRQDSDDGGGGGEGAMTIGVNVRDKSYAPQENAAVNIRITDPAGKFVDLVAERSVHEAGLYQADYIPRQPGPYRATVTAAAPDGSDIGTAAAGWTSDPAAEEFRDLQPNPSLLDRIAHATGGEMVQAADLPAFAATLPTRHAQITEGYVQPFWHQSWVFLLAIACLAVEWALRRLKGLP